MRPRKLVLVVDGDAERLGTRRLLLENQAHLRVVPCGSGEDALVLLRGGLRVEVLVSEWQLPGMDGNELCALAAQLDPLTDRVLLDAARENVPEGCWAHRFLGRRAGSVELLEVCRMFSSRRRGPKKSAAVRAGMARAAAARAALQAEAV